jgi:DNA-binding transcriptional LysR family regulator
MRALDLDAVGAFVLVADLNSFTRAAEAQGTTQSAISLKIQRLERRLGRRLVERTPRLVRLSGDGESFLARARDLLAAHERAVNGDEAVCSLRFGISDHAAGPDLAVLLARINRYDPQMRLDVRIGASREMVVAFDGGELDAVIVRREGERRDGEVLLHDRFGWFAAPTYVHRPGEPLRLGTTSSVCGVRSLAIRALDAEHIPWVEAFVGGGVAALAAAVASGLAVAPLARRVAPPGAVDIGPTVPLPDLPPSEVVLYARISDPRLAGAVRTLAAAFRSFSR